MKDLRTLTVNWDIARVMQQNWTLAVAVELAHDKTHWRQSIVDQLGDVGNIVWPSLEALCIDYLVRRRLVLARNLEVRAKYDVTFRDDVHGDGSHICFTLFLGFWDESQISGFTHTKMSMQY